MKATGIVRRIDDLGRVVIPKEIRRTMRIREGDPLEIYTDREGEVIFKKYSLMGELNEFAGQYADTLFKTAGLSVAICDKDAVVATAGLPKKEFAEKRVSERGEEAMEGRTLLTCTPEDRFELTAEGHSSFKVSVFAPILCEGDVIGAVVSLKNEGADPSPVSAEVEQSLIRTAATFLGKQLES
ncbi:MAG: AbrB/MazE/SpoVT family DNA-binding domain-containing protein [Clostridia bacterium]|nr:AbrB/MazE/SpoVT family DNA-binding domain-containing protein [Clostridia bacterium]